MGKGSILHDKELLAIVADPELLKSIEAGIVAAPPYCRLDKAATYQEGADKLVSWTYDLVLLDQMITQREKLLEIAQLRKLPIILLTYPNFIMKFAPVGLDRGIHSCLPVEGIKEIALFIENFFTSFSRPTWKKGIARLSDALRSILSFRRK